MDKVLTSEQASALLRGNPLHAWYSTQHMLASGDVVYEGVDGKPTAVTFVCWDKSRGEEWVKQSQYTDYVYIGLVSNKFLGDVGATELI